MQVYDHSKNGDYEQWMRQDDNTPQEESYTTLKAKTDMIQKQQEQIDELKETIKNLDLLLKDIHDNSREFFKELLNK